MPVLSFGLFANTGSHEMLPFGLRMMFVMLLVGLIMCLAFEEKLHAKKSVIAGLFAVVCLFLGALNGILPFEEVVVGSHEITISKVLEENSNQPETSQGETSQGAGELKNDTKKTTEPKAAEKPTTASLHEGGHELSMPVYIPAIDWGVIAIILGSSLFVDAISKSGLFTWIAIKATKASRGDPAMLLLFYGIMTVVFSAVLNNVTAMIIVGSLSAVSLNKLNRSSMLPGFLICEGLLTNIGGLLTLISSVPNIIVGSAANISFMEFFIKSAPYVLVTTFVTLFMAARRFKIKRITGEVEKQEAMLLVSRFDENDGIESEFSFWFGAIMTVLFIVTIAGASALPIVSDLGMGFVALAFAVISLIQYRATADQLYKAIDWDLLGFFAALFVVIYVMEHAQVLEMIGSLLSVVIGLGETTGVAALLVSAALFSSVTDNIPLAAMLSKILENLEVQTAGDGIEASKMWWSVIFGANLGGNITPIGSASTLVAVTVMHKHKIPMSFMGFVKIAFPFAVIQIGIAVLYVLLFI